MTPSAPYPSVRWCSCLYATASLSSVLLITARVRLIILQPELHQQPCAATRYSASQDMHESCSHASPRIPYDIGPAEIDLRHQPDAHHKQVLKTVKTLPKPHKVNLTARNMAAVKNCTRASRTTCASTRKPWSTDSICLASASGRELSTIVMTQNRDA